MSISARLLLPSGLAFLAILATPGLASRQSSGIRKVIQSTLALSINDFAFDLYRKIGTANAGENVVLSPVSISLALASVYVGARGETKSQIATAMHLDNYSSNDEPINEGFKSLIETIDHLNNNYSLQMANRLYAHSGHEFAAEYLQVTNDYYRTSPEELDFADDASAARETINIWVAMMTSNKFEELFQEDSITSDNSLVLISAVYLKASWLYKFDRRATTSQTFHLSASEENRVQMMSMPRAYGLRYANFTELLDCRVLELPYSDDELSMFIFLPNKIEGLSSLEDRLNAKTLDRVFRDVVDADTVQVSLPKFVLEQEVDLRKALTEVGVDDLFDYDTVDLSGIYDTGDLVLNNALHKASIEANEEGTEGVAATGVVAFPATELPTINFSVDRPFLFCLMEKATGIILFLGRVMNPLQSN